MLVRAFAVAAVLLLADPSAVSSVAPPAPDLGPVPAVVSASAGPTDDTINEFLPEDRGLGDCISALPKPGCGSEARGGWRQGLVLLAIIAGLAVIAWRVVAASRSARRGDTVSADRTPDATSARGDSSGDPSP